MRKLSILEIGKPENENDVEVINDTIALAEKADKLGYTRFWLGEHHDDGAWRSPDLLISIIAAKTKRIRIGSGGILLPINNPLRIAQNYKFLSTLFPDRIDLGLARGFTSSLIAAELLEGSNIEETVRNHLARMQKTIKYLKNKEVYLSKDECIIGVPRDSNFPDIWVLGSTGNTMDFAIQEKINYSFSLLHASNRGDKEKPFMDFYKKFKQINNETPKTNITIGLLCGKNKNECENLIKSQTDSFLAVNIFGEKTECKEKLLELYEKFKTEEIMIHFICKDNKHRESCYELFSDLNNSIS